MDSHFLKLLVCPLCNSPLRHDQIRHELICQHDQLAFPIKNGIPVLLKEEARSLSQTHSATASAADNEPQTVSPSHTPAQAGASAATDAATKATGSAASRTVPPDSSRH